MISVNLLPDSVRAARLRRRRLRAWTAVVALSAVLAAGPLGWNGVRSTRAASIERQVDPLRGEVEELRNRLKTLTAQQQQLHDDLERAEALRRKRSWSALLSGLAEQMPAQVWLTALESTTPSADFLASINLRTPPAAGAEEAKPTGPVRLSGPTGLRLAGFALDHEALYAFISTLKRMGIFQTVDLTQADKQPFGETEAVAFVLVCTWTGSDG